MKLQHLLKCALGLVLTLCVTVLAGCSEKDNKENPKGPALSVSPGTISLSSAANSTATFTVTTSAAWTVAVWGEGFTLDKQEGTGNAVITVTANAANTTSEIKPLGSVVITATGVRDPQTVQITQTGTDTPDPGPEPEPEPDPTPGPGALTLTVDFTQGIDIATPALPNQKAEAKKGLTEYKIGDYTYTIYTDEALNGVYYWIDNTVFPGNTAPEPNKGLFFGKLGAYIKFPAIAGKTLTKVTYTPTSSQSGDVKLDLVGSDGEDISCDNPTPFTTYTLIEPAENTAYRLQIINSKNAQIAKVVLTYAGKE